MMDKERSEAMMEPAVVPTELQPSPPSKAASVHSAEPVDNEKKYETIQTIKMSDAKDNMKSTTMEKPISIMNSSLNLLSNQEVQQEASSASRKGVSANTKLGIIQLVLSVLLSAFGGLLLARNASLSTMGSGLCIFLILISAHLKVQFTDKCCRLQVFGQACLPAFAAH
jgi:hypothetical protein